MERHKIGPFFGNPQTKVVPKPWGRELWLDVTDKYALKILEVDAGHRLSVQYHKVKLETLYLLAGEARLLWDGVWTTINPGANIRVNPTTVHSIEAVSDSSFIEGSYPYLEDVIRIEDRYDRQDKVQ